ncbi:MAG: ATPase [Verrucomicrobia bacterium]|nr:ATPase [Verrucomicrobiota bacterium]
MEDYIGRSEERQEFRRLLQKKTASLVTCQGRRRIGKSRFIHECAQEADHFLSFMGLPPREDIMKQAQLDAFADQLSQQTKAPKLPLDGWPSAFQLLASQLPASGTVVLLLDEISWMAVGDADYPGHLKTAWDTHFSKRARLVVVLCGSVSSWIEQNILNNTGFVGRCSWQFRLGPLLLTECMHFWGKRGTRISITEKLRLLAVTGGVPRYLQEINPARTAEQNIADLCFNPAGMLFNEFDSIFHDIFTRRAESYREIVRTLVAGSRSVDQISTELGRARGGTLSASLMDLAQAGFISHDIPFEPETGRSRPRDARYRLSDNYLRFYLKYVDPVKPRIIKGLLKNTALESLDAWDTIMGLQFENLVHANLNLLLAHIGLDKKLVLNAGPYVQKQTLRKKGCQIDLLIRTRRSLYIFEIKFRKHIPSTIIDETSEKVKRLKLPKGQSVRTGLIYCGELDAQIDERDDFDFLVSAEALVKID